MTIQLFEQTPGVFSGDWHDPRTGKQTTIVVIKSLDGWVAYLGKERLGKEFSSHQDAASYAIKSLEHRSTKRRLARGALQAAAGLAGIAVLASALQFALPGLSGKTSQVAELTDSAINETRAVTQIKTAAKQQTSSETTVRLPSTTSVTASSSSKRDDSTQTAQALPEIDEKKAHRAPWELPFRALFASKTDNAAQSDQADITTGSINKRIKTLPKDKHVEVAALALDQSKTATDIKTTSSSLAVINGRDSQAQADAYDRADLEADIAADSNEIATTDFDGGQQQEVSSVEVAAATTESKALPSLATFEKQSAKSSARAHTTRLPLSENRDQNADKPAKQLAALDADEPKLLTKERAKKKYKAKKRKKRAKRKYNRYKKKKRSRRRSLPLVRKRVRRDAYGRRYVVYEARRPRNRREYKRLIRIQRAIIRKQRRRLYRY